MKVCKCNEPTNIIFDEKNHAICEKCGGREDVMDWVDNKSHFINLLIVGSIIALAILIF